MAENESDEAAVFRDGAVTAVESTHVCEKNMGQGFEEPRRNSAPRRVTLGEMLHHPVRSCLVECFVCVVLIGQDALSRPTLQCFAQGSPLERPLI